MSNNVVIGSENIEGNITSCKIENQKKSVQKNSTFSIQQTSTYITYDVCNRETIAEYQVPEFASFGIFLFMLVPIVLIQAGLTKLFSY